MQGKTHLDWLRRRFGWNRRFPGDRIEYLKIRRFRGGATKESVEKVKDRKGYGRKNSGRGEKEEEQRTGGSLSAMAALLGAWVGCCFSPLPSLATAHAPSCHTATGDVAMIVALVETQLETKLSMETETCI